MSTSPVKSQHTAPPPSRAAHHHHSHSHSLTSSSPASSSLAPSMAASLAGIGAGPSLGKAGAAFRASVDVGASLAARGGLQSRSGATGASAATTQRPSSELLGVLPSGQFHSEETEAIDRWFEDLQHYESTLEEMSAAALDTNFKEELSAIEQWFRVLSEAERTAALYSLLQSATHVQMRFFITVLQQMARSDPVAGGLMSPAGVGQSSMEAQMEAKLAALQLNSSPNTNSNSKASPASPSRFARQSLGASDSYLSPHSANISGQNAGGTEDAAATLASQRSKLKPNARTSAPANLRLSSSTGAGPNNASLWSERERVAERSPSPSGRPKSSSGGSDTGSQRNGVHGGQHPSQSTGPVNSSTFLRSPGPNATDFEAQLSPLVGGSWASMVNTPLVPMFSKTGDGGTFGSLSSPSFDATSSRMQNTWSGSNSTSGNSAGPGSIVLDDVRKFRRSARVSGTGVNGGALGGMYDDALGNGLAPQHHPQQAQQQQQRRVSPSQLSNLSMQQNAINLGLGGLPRANGSSNGPASPGLLNAQQAAVAAQNNWRNGLMSPGGTTQTSQHLETSPSVEQQYASAGAFTPHSAQLANLLALQQQMQMQQLNMAAAAGMALTPVQMMGLQQQQQQLLSPGGRMMGMGIGGVGPMGAMGTMGMMGNMGMGMGLPGMASPRRSPRSNERSPGGNVKSSNQVVAGSGSNPDEPLDLQLIADVPAWLRSLRLHKYTPNFEGANWKDMVMLDDAGLEGKGVSALGARRKLLKVFETVRIKTGMSPPPVDSALPVPADGTSSRSLSPAGDSPLGDA